MERTVVLRNPMGLHARPAALLIQKASTYPGEITLIYGDKKANAKSIMNVIALGAGINAQITIFTAGERAAEALQDIGDFLALLKE